MSLEAGQKPAEQPKTSIPEHKEAPLTLGSIGKQIQKEFTSPEHKNLITGEFSKSFTEKISQFTEEFRKKFCNENGQPDLKKILSLFGLEKFLGDQISPDGQVVLRDKPSSEQPPILGFEFGAGSSGKIPERPGTALTGSQFLAEMNKLGDMNNKQNQHRMEQYVLTEIEKGNVPSFCRPENMKSMTMQANGIQVQYKAGLDYLAIGSDNDYVRVPMTPVLAQALSQRYGWGLPTAAMTDNIYAGADIRLQGIGLVHSKEDEYHMQGNEFINRHNQKIDQQLGPQGLARLRSGQALVAGHKKDVIISRYAIDHPGKLDFRGLYINGRPIQTNPAHEDTYRDYSHGFRPIDGYVTIAYPDGRQERMKYYDALKNPQIAGILNGAEGAIDAAQAYRSKSIQSSGGTSPHLIA